MELTNTEVLEYLHDAVVVRLVYEPLREDCRVLLLNVACDSHAGHPDWNGRNVLIRLHDIYLANHFVFGAVTGDEQINSWTDSVSASMGEMIERLPTAIGRGIRFSVSFHSGSLLEGVCHRVFVDLEEISRFRSPS